MHGPGQVCKRAACSWVLAAAGCTCSCLRTSSAESAAWRSWRLALRKKEVSSARAGASTDDRSARGIWRLSAAVTQGSGSKGSSGTELDSGATEQAGCCRQSRRVGLACPVQAGRALSFPRPPHLC